MIMTNFNTYSQNGVWEQGRSPVGRVTLIPTFIDINKILHCSIHVIYINIFSFFKLLYFANLRRDEGNPTYNHADNISLSAKLQIIRNVLNEVLKTTNFKRERS